MLTSLLRVPFGKRFAFFIFSVFAIQLLHFVNWTDFHAYTAHTHALRANSISWWSQLCMNGRRCVYKRESHVVAILINCDHTHRTLAMTQYSVRRERFYTCRWCCSVVASTTHWLNGSRYVHYALQYELERKNEEEEGEERIELCCWRIEKFRYGLRHECVPVYLCEWGNTVNESDTHSLCDR